MGHPVVYTVLQIYTITSWKVLLIIIIHTPFRIAFRNIILFSHKLASFPFLWTVNICKETIIISFPLIRVIYGNLFQITSSLAYFGGVSSYLEMITNLAGNLSISVILYTKPTFYNRKPKSIFITKSIKKIVKHLVTKGSDCLERYFRPLNEKLQTQF